MVEVVVVGLIGMEVMMGMMGIINIHQNCVQLDCLPDSARMTPLSPSLQPRVIYHSFRLP